jgi:hypothetical protein
MSNEASTHEAVAHASGENIGVLGWIVVVLLAVVALAVSVGMFAVGILSVFGVL